MSTEPPILTGAPPYSNQPPNIASDSISTITIPNVRLCENNEKSTVNGLCCVELKGNSWITFSCPPFIPKNGLNNDALLTISKQTNTPTISMGVAIIIAGKNPTLSIARITIIGMVMCM